MIRPEHLAEWVQGSGVSAEIAERAIVSLDDPREIDQALNRNTQSRYKHWAGGPGWLVRGVDPDTGEYWNKGCQFKPDMPFKTGQIRADGTEKTIKYVNAAGNNADPLFLAMPDPEYWRKVKASTQIRWLLEGAKKAGALLSHGRAAISICSVTAGQNKGRLRPMLLPYLEPGIKVMLGWDSDWRTNRNVRNALKVMGALLKERGCLPYVPIWDESIGKGIDDFLVNGGDLDEVEANAITFQEWMALIQNDDSITNKTIYDELGTDPEDHVKDITFDAHCYDRLFDKGNGDWCVLSSAFFEYNEGYWHAHEDEEIFRKISQQSLKAYKVKATKNEYTALYPFSTKTQIHSAFGSCRHFLCIPPNRLPANDHLIAFNNGTVDVRTGEMVTHDRNHYLTWKVAADYVPNAECPEVFTKFIDSAFGLELLPVFRAYFSMILDPTAPYGKFMHLIGGSGTGKGTLIHLVGEMLGIKNYRSSNNFGVLNTAETRHQQLTGVRLFALPDVGGYLRDIRDFYSLVDDEPLSGRALFSSSGYQKQWHLRFIIASVDYLRVENAGDGWNRRVIPVPTKQRTDPADITLKTRLAEKKAEIISWALAMPKDERNEVLWNLHQYEAIELARSESALSGDSIRFFVDSCLRPNPTYCTVESHELHTLYEAFCLVHGFNRNNYTNFVNHLKTILPNHHVPRRRMTKEEKLAAGKVPDSNEMRQAHWKHIQILPDIFSPPVENLVKCYKDKCVAGGESAFNDFSMVDDTIPAHTNGHSSHTPEIEAIDLDEEWECVTEN